MDFGLFGIGVWELLVIGLIALIVLGPKQMIRMARQAGELLRQFQQVWLEASKTIDKELRAIEDDTSDLGSLGKEIESLPKDIKSAVTVSIPGNGGTPTIRPPDASTPAPTPAKPTAAPTPPSAWGSSPPPLTPQTTTGPASQSPNPPTGQPADTPETQSPSLPAARPQTRYPAWTSKPNN